MKAWTIHNPTRNPLLVPLLCALLCFVVTSGSEADDPDDDWGLPTLTDEDDGSSDDGSEESEIGPDDGTDIRVAVEVVETETPEQQVGQIFLDRDGHEGTTFTYQGLPGQKAELNSPDGSAPVTASVLGDGISVQGFGRLRLPPRGEGSLRARLLAPEGGRDHRAFVIVDQMGSLQELVSDPTRIPTGVTAFVPLGEGVDFLNLNAFQNVVETYGHKFIEGHISVVLLSLDDQDKLHVAAARLGRDGGIMEVVAQ